MPREAALIQERREELEGQGWGVLFYCVLHFKLLLQIKVQESFMYYSQCHQLPTWITISKCFGGVLIQNIELNLHQGPLLHDIPSDLYFQLFT